MFDELAQEQYALTGFRMHPHHRMFRLVVVGDELLAVFAHRVRHHFLPAVDVSGVVVGVGVHRPQILGERAQWRGQQLVRGLRVRPCGGAAVVGQ